MDVNECSYGALGLFLPGGLTDCQWKNYYVDYNLYELDPVPNY